MSLKFTYSTTKIREEINFEKNCQALYLLCFKSFQTFKYDQNI